MKRSKFVKGFIKSMPLIIALAALVVLLIVLSVLKGNTAVAEWFTFNISQYIVFIFGSVTKFLPFSVVEMLGIAAIIITIMLIVYGIMFLVKKKYYMVWRGFLIFTIVVLSVVNFYTMAAGFAYNRASLPLPMSGETYIGDAVNNIAQFFIDDYVYLDTIMPRDDEGNVIPPYTRRELSEVLKKEFARLDDSYFFSFTPNVKPFFNSWLFSDMGFTGMAFLPTGEPHYNTMAPPSTLPQIMAHEIAHTKGVMRENEANLVSYYILISSDDPYLRYCGYFASIGYLQEAVALGNNNNWNIATQVFSQLPQKALAEKARVFSFWANYKGPIKFLSDVLDDVGEFINDIYLKLNGQKDGTGSYIIPPGQIIEDIDPDTQQPVIIPVYSPIHKVYFSIYESKH